MKYRNGFVSNSSSSSFIVAVARVVDEAKLTSWLSTLKLNKYDYGITSIKDIEEDVCGSLTKTGDIVIVESFRESVRLDTKNMDENDKIFFVNIVNNEGDPDFNVYDEDGGWVDYNYDIDIDFFDEEQIKLFDGLNENHGVSDVERKYGAGRNG